MANRKRINVMVIAVSCDWFISTLLKNQLLNVRFFSKEDLTSGQSAISSLRSVKFPNKTLEFGMYAADTIVLPVKKKELGASTAHRRDWKGIITALIVIFAICGLIFLCGYIFTPLNGNEYNPSHRLLNLSDLYKYRSSTLVKGWLADRLLYENEEGIYTLTSNGNQSLVVSFKEIHDILQYGAEIKCNFDCSFVSLTTSMENPSVNPDKAKNIVHVLNLKTKSLIRVTRDSKQPEGINFLQWSPNGIDYIFAQNGRLYYVAEAGLSPVDIALKGDTQIHGYYDWMMEEEISYTYEAVWWSKDGSQIAFASRDIITEPAITLTAYRGAERYQIDTKLVYPKTGEKNLPIYTVSIWDKTSGSTRQMDVQHRNSASFHYLYSVSWTNSGDLSVLWTNRWQNHTELTYCTFKTSICKLTVEHSFPSKTWTLPDEHKDLGSFTTRDSAFMILPRQMPDGNSYQHIARVRIDDPATKQFLPSGNFDVKEMVYHDEANRLIYFMTMAPLPAHQHLYVTDYKQPSRLYSCVTCAINCTYATPTFSSNGKRLSIQCSGSSYTRHYLADVKNGQLDNIAEIFHDQQLEKLVEQTYLPVNIDDSIQLENGYEALTRLILPRNRGHLRALPLLVYVYGGPGYQVIEKKFSVSFIEYLVTNLHIAVLKIDARGSGARGWNYRSPVYSALGTAEIEDQISAVQLALKKYNFLDSTKTALFGWSYGGFATLRMVETAPERLFKCAISGAPVTNFQYYDAAYTERYMGSAPKEAYTDVNRGDLGKFNKTRLLLIHGISDDNVHFQNSAVFAESMQISQVDFDFMPYPNERHHLRGNKYTHGYTKITGFLRECLLH